MKKTNIIKCILFSVIFIFCGNINAQEFAPIGAQWHYSIDGYSMNIESVKDTLFNGNLCKILKKSFITCDMRGWKEIIYTDSGKVYFYDEWLQQFQLLYDFNASVNQTWSILMDTGWCGFSDTVTIKVDSLSSILINGIKLKVLHISSIVTSEQISGPCWGVNKKSQIIENIGDTISMFPWYYEVCEGEYIYGLRCYEDSLLGWYVHNNQIDSVCDTILYVGNKEEKVQTQIFSIFSNPVQHKLFVQSMHKGITYSNIHIEVFTVYGQIVYRGCYSTQEFFIDFSGFANGVYFVRLKNKDNISFYKISKI